MRFDWRNHDVNDGDAVDDEFTATGLTVVGGVPVATLHGVWENGDGAAIVPFLGSFNNPALTLGGATDFYANIHSNQFPGGAIRGQLVLLSTDAGETINGVAGTRNDILPGLGGNDIINGLAGNDTLDGGTGNDRMNGGAGNDTYVVGSTGDVVSEAVNQGIDTIRTTITRTLPVNVENLTLLGTAVINGTGNALANVMTGNAARNIFNGLTGNDIINGLGGNDTIDGGVGNDRMLGGIGNDTYTINSTGDVVTELANQGTDTLRTTITKTLPVNVENLVLLGVASISGTGNALANIITGNSGNNTLNGLGGVDRMIGGLGNDIYFVDHISDLVTEAGGAGTDTIRSTVSETLSLNVENLVLLGPANITGIGNNLANNITGNSGNNLIDGRGGADIMVGGLGNDTYLVDDGSDVVVEGLNQGTDTIQTLIDAVTMSANVDNMILLGASNIGGIGNSIANTITGNAGINALTGLGGADILAGGGGIDTLIGGGDNDTLNGGVADDILIGGTGADTMIGGTGADEFRIASPAEFAAGEVINGVAESGTIDTVVLATAGIYNFQNGNVQNIDRVSLTQDAAGYNIVVSDPMAKTAQGDSSDAAPELDIRASVTLTNGVTINASGVTAAGSIRIDGNPYGGADNFTGGAGDDALGSGAGNDVCVGGAGADIISGQSGADTITGGTGGDFFEGGADSDDFRYLGAADLNEADGIDTILDFAAGDQFDFSAIVLMHNIDAIFDKGNGIYASGTTADFFNNGGTDHSIAVQTNNSQGSTRVFVDTDNDGDYTPDFDLTIHCGNGNLAAVLTNASAYIV